MQGTGWLYPADLLKIFCDRGAVFFRIYCIYVVKTSFQRSSRCHCRLCLNTFYNEAHVVSVLRNSLKSCAEVDGTRSAPGLSPDFSPALASIASVVLFRLMWSVWWWRIVMHWCFVASFLLFYQKHRKGYSKMSGLRCAHKSSGRRLFVAIYLWNLAPGSA